MPTFNTTDAFVGMFQIPEPGVAIAKINSFADCTMEVSEEIDYSGKRIISIAQIDITNVDITEGTISSVIIETKKNSESTWRILPAFSVSWTGSDNSGQFFVKDMQFDDNGITHDFRAYFLNIDGEKAYDLVTGKTIGVATPSGAGYLEDSCIFNGRDDLVQHPAVLNLKATNANITEGGNYNAPAHIPNNGIIRLEWDNMKVKGTITNHPFADGIQRFISGKQWRTIEGYVVYIYIAVLAGPTNEYPVQPEVDAANGTWYVVGETQNTFIEIDCPKNKKVAFYVACKAPFPSAPTVITSTRIPFLQY